MGWLASLFKRRDEAAGAGLWDEIVAVGRQPHWYIEGRVPDTLDGRFDMIAATLAMVLLHLETLPDGPAMTVRLTERFVDDMDAQIRQIGFGDMVVGKHVGSMMGMLGGRLGAYREGLASGSFGDALVRNLYRGDNPGAEAVAHVAARLIDWQREIAARSPAALSA